LLLLFCCCCFFDVFFFPLSGVFTKILEHARDTARLSKEWRDIRVDKSKQLRIKAAIAKGKDHTKAVLKTEEEYLAGKLGLSDNTVHVHSMLPEKWRGHAQPQSSRKLPTEQHSISPKSAVYSQNYSPKWAQQQEQQPNAAEGEQHLAGLFHSKNEGELLGAVDFGNDAFLKAAVEKASREQQLKFDAHHSMGDSDQKQSLDSGSVALDSAAPNSGPDQTREDTKRSMATKPQGRSRTPMFPRPQEDHNQLKEEDDDLNLQNDQNENKWKPKQEFLPDQLVKMQRRRTSKEKPELNARTASLNVSENNPKEADKFNFAVDKADGLRKWPMISDSVKKQMIFNSQMKSEKQRQYIDLIKQREAHKYDEHMSTMSRLVEMGEGSHHSSSVDAPMVSQPPNKYGQLEYHNNAIWKPQRTFWHRQLIGAPQKPKTVKEVRPGETAVVRDIQEVVVPDSLPEPDIDPQLFPLVHNTNYLIGLKRGTPTEWRYEKIQPNAQPIEFDRMISTLRKQGQKGTQVSHSQHPHGEVPQPPRSRVTQKQLEEYQQHHHVHSHCKPTNQTIPHSHQTYRSGSQTARQPSRSSTPLGSADENAANLHHWKARSFEPVLTGKRTNSQRITILKPFPGFDLVRKKHEKMFIPKSPREQAAMEQEAISFRKKFLEVRAVNKAPAVVPNKKRELEKKLQKEAEEIRMNKNLQRFWNNAFPA